NVIKDSDAIKFIGRIVSSEDSGDIIRNRRKNKNKPYNITDNQKYYKSLVDKDNINILLIGPDESGTNYDTMLIASIDDKNNIVKLINLPRDIYIEYSNEVKNELKKVWPSYTKSKGIYKINAAHTLGKRIKYKDSKGRFNNPEFDFTCDLIEEVFGIFIDDLVYLKPSSLRRVVDYFGGVEIDVPYLMKYNDPTQNLTINIKKGLQILDGEKAEGFVRYRQGIDENGKYKSIGDIERKKNQITFVNAFIDQHLTLKNIGKIVTIFNDLSSYVTSSIDNGEKAGEYGKLAKKLHSNNFTQISEEIECSNVRIESIYYLKIKTAD
ncbi:MAG: LCP family protein, partial [Clostridiaceae bacterium]|nr:LCP family protein [Clostridiaceae bacterium]